MSGAGVQLLSKYMYWYCFVLYCIVLYCILLYCIVTVNAEL
jgi:hypothetical protein